MHKVPAFVLALTLCACGGSPPPKPVPEARENARDVHETGIDSFREGRYHDALANFELAGRLFTSIDDPRGVAVAAISAAETHLLMGDADAARASSARAADALAVMHDETLSERVQLVVARVDADATASRRTLEDLRGSANPPIAAQAKLLLCERGIEAGDAGCLAGLAAQDELTAARIDQLQAKAARARGEDEAAKRHLDRALMRYRALAFRPGIAAVHETLAAIAAKGGERAVAERHLQRALYLRFWIQDRTGSADLLEQLADVTGNEQLRNNYRGWRETLRDANGDPDWSAMMQEIFSSE